MTLGLHYLPSYQVISVVMAALLESSFDFQIHHHSFAPTEAYARDTTLVTVGGKSDPGNIIRTECWRLEEAGWRVMGESPIPVTVEIFSLCDERGNPGHGGIH